MSKLFSRPVKADNELKVLAIEMSRGVIFTDRELGEHRDEMLMQVFAPLGNMTRPQILRFLQKKPDLIYGRLEHASGLKVAGPDGKEYLVFDRCEYLNESETRRFFCIYQALETRTERGEVNVK